MSLALLVTGAGGQLGADLLALARPAADIAFARGMTSTELDLTDPFAVRDVVAGWARVVRSDDPAHQLVVVNAAAYTAVDAAESDEVQAYAVNAAGPALLAAACGRAGAGLIQVSTDYVFAGDAGRDGAGGGPAQPYEVDSPTGPTGAYGRTKLAGEEAVRAVLPDASWVVRTAWLYGGTGSNFVKTMAALEATRDTVSVVDDQRGSPTWSRDLAQGLLELARRQPPAGILHATNSGAATWRDLAAAVFVELGADPGRVLATTSAAYPRPAPRPAYSVLSGAAWAQAGLTPLRDWRAALAAAFALQGEAFRPA